MKKTQKEIMLQIIEENQPIRTPKLKLLSLRRGISCGDRRVRELQEAGKVRSHYDRGNKTKTWEIVN